MLDLLPWLMVTPCQNRSTRCNINGSKDFTISSQREIEVMSSWSFGFRNFTSCCDRSSRAFFTSAKCIAKASSNLFWWLLSSIDPFCAPSTKNQVSPMHDLCVQMGAIALEHVWAYLCLNLWLNFHIRWRPLNATNAHYGEKTWESFTGSGSWGGSWLFQNTVTTLDPRINRDPRPSWYPYSSDNFPWPHTNMAHHDALFSTSTRFCDSFAVLFGV